MEQTIKDRELYWKHVFSELEDIDNNDLKKLIEEYDKTDGAILTANANEHCIDEM